MKTETEETKLAMATQAQAQPAVPDAEDDVNMRDLLRNNVRSSWKVSADHLHANIAYMSPDARELLKWAFSWSIDPAHPIHFEEFCSRLGLAENTVYKILSGKYKHPDTGARMDLPEKTLRALRDFRRLELSRAKLGRARFVITPTAKKVFLACDQARKSSLPVFIFGASQIGKTEALKHYAVENNHGKTILIEIDAVTGMTGLLHSICEKVGVSSAGCNALIMGRLKKALSTDMVLIFDEIHQLANTMTPRAFFKCIELLRRLWDGTKCGVVFTFTELGYAALEKERKRELVQLFRRGIQRINLGNVPTAEDVRLITTAYGLSWADRHETYQITPEISDTGWSVVKQLSHEEGLKAIIERVRLANDFAADQDRTEITWNDFLIAHYSVLKNSLQPVTGWEK